MASNPIYALFWIIVLAIAWPIAMACAVIWILIQPFEACCTCFKDISRSLEGFVKWPQDCGVAIKNCSSSCPSPV
eukprot:scaffold6592_cov103-Skeletonema_dohrnii-CCMP3373.AAC.5